jgi:predicted nucleic acid-binding protein
MRWVLDCSVALAWGLPDEGSRLADELFSDLSADSVLWIPALWWYEVSSALSRAHRQGRLSEADMAALIRGIGSLPVRTDPLLGEDAIRRFRTLARDYTLSAYDAAYLELAMRRSVGLATLDTHLADAARNVGVEVFGT